MPRNNRSPNQVALVAQKAHSQCLAACQSFPANFDFDPIKRADQIWWKETFEGYPEELARRIQEHLLEAKLTETGCLQIGCAQVPPSGANPQRVFWRGRRQKVYQLIAWGLLGELPTKKSVVRHLCNNRLCIHPDHMKIGTQAQNLRDQHFNKAGYWPHQ